VTLLIFKQNFFQDPSLCWLFNLEAKNRYLSRQVTGLSWAKERLMKHHGVSKHRFPLYLKELEFRYSHRAGDLFDLIANYLCDLVLKQD
jgi:transposase